MRLVRRLAAAALACLAAGGAAAEDPPRRPAALSWAMTEQLLDLDVTPGGVADVEGYRRWVVAPPLPADVADLGRRQEPSLEAIAALGPDLILISDDQDAFAGALARFAPVLHRDAFSDAHDNAAAARAIYLDLAARFGREDLARERLAAQDARLADLRARIARRFDGAPPKVTIVRFLDEARVAIYGPNAMTTAALHALGLESGLRPETGDWGLAIRPIADLGAVAEGHVMHIRPFPKAGRTFASPLWSAMPFVRAGRFHALPPLWTYGGALSVGRIAEAVAATLLAAPDE